VQKVLTVEARLLSVGTPNALSRVLAFTGPDRCQAAIQAADVKASGIRMLSVEIFSVLIFEQLDQKSGWKDDRNER
jgi:hypothetical protein